MRGGGITRGEGGGEGGGEDGGEDGGDEDGGEEDGGEDGGEGCAIDEVDGAIVMRSAKTATGIPDGDGGPPTRGAAVVDDSPAFISCTRRRITGLALATACASTSSLPPVPVASAVAADNVESSAVSVF